MTKKRALLIILLLIIIALLGAVVSILGGYVTTLLPSWLTADPPRIWGLIAVMIVLSAILGYWLYRLQSDAGEQKQPLSTQNRANMLARVRFRVKEFFEDSLHGAELLVLGLHKESHAVADPWGLHIQQHGQPEPNLPPGTRISTAFKDAGGALLILGNPGAGKSTLLYELASDLLSLAEADKEQKIPVIFTLASWAVEQKPLAEWMVEVLKHEYREPPKIAQAWVKSGLLLPLLDGLDEVERSHRDACVEAIKTYCQEHDVFLVVSCRREEYEELEKRVQLNAAVMVQPLTPAQIDEYLANAKGQLEAVRLALHDDPTLQELAASPLLLSVIALAYRGMPVDDLLTTPPEERQQHIFDTYINRMLTRKRSNNFRPEQAIRWLGWLAIQMRRQSQTEFYLEQMQPDWLPTQRSRRLYFTAVVLIFGLVGGLVFGLVFGLVGGLILGLVSGLVFGLSGEPLDAPRRTQPNQGIRRSAINSAIGGLVGGLIFGLVGGLVGGLVFGLRGGLVFGLVFFLIRGGVASVQHLVLRVLLWLTGCTPRRYIQFLDYARRCILLRRAGGGGMYAFIHPLLQDYFAGPT